MLGEKWVWKFKGVTSDGETRANGTDTKEVILIDDQLFLSEGGATIPLTEVVEPDVSTTPRFDWPLEVGKQWVFEQRWTSQDGTKGQSRFNARVDSYQLRQVEAGVFMAYTITFTGKITNSRGYNAATEEIFWYAPETKMFIKLVQQQDYLYEEELIEYVQP